MTKQLKANGKTYLIPELDRLRLGETAAVQEYLAGDLGRLAGFESGDLRAVIAVLWLALHRADPSVTLDQVEQFDLDEFEVVDLDENGNPISGGDGGPPAEGAAGAPQHASTVSLPAGPQSSGIPSSPASTG